MTWIVEIAYPAPISPELDDQLLQLAERYGGRWSGSGCGVAEQIPERDVEFCFRDRSTAERFAESCWLLAVVCVISITKE